MLCFCYTFLPRKLLESLFLLISRFECSELPLQEQLAKMIRAMSEKHTKRLLVIFCGGAGF